MTIHADGTQTRKVLLITGSVRGLGATLARAAAADGHHVAINYRSDVARAEAFASDLSRGPGEAIALNADVSDQGQVTRLIDDVVDRFGRIDCVINNAGIGEVIAIEELDLAAFERTLHANLTSAFLVSQAAWPRMKRDGGRLIFMSSAAARSGGRLSAAYAASKGGVEGLMHAYAAALRRYRITANAIAPALIEGGMTDMMDLGPLGNLPMGRLGRAEELWPAVCMILETEYLTGQTIHIDAGRYPT